MAEPKTKTDFLPSISSLPPDIAALLAIGGDTLVNEPIVGADGTSYVLVGKDIKVEKIPALNPVLPDFVTAAESFVEPDSFIEYITKFKTKDAVVLASLSKTSFVAKLDYHGDARQGSDAAVPGRNAHAVTLNCPWDQDYAKWRAVFDKPILQADLMEFFEDVIHTIGLPLAGDLLDAIGNVELDRSSKFKSVRNLRNGTVQFVYAEDERNGEDGPFLDQFVEEDAPLSRCGHV